MILNLIIIVCFLSATLGLQPLSHAGTVLGLPEPGTMVNLSPAYWPVILKGLRVHPENPVEFDFIVDTGNSGLSVSDPQLKAESAKLIKYFLASLTIPEDDLWVNLSPYEKNRIIPDQLGRTEMGRDMLAEDYILKQVAASLIYPESDLGKEFWDRVYSKTQQLYGTKGISVNTFNKVWIMADKAKVFVHNNMAFVVASHLKVMLEEDYLAIQKNQRQPDKALKLKAPQGNNPNALTSQIVRQIILPQLEKEVNDGQNFANLRQIFHSMILAAWYKKTLKKALLNQVYSNKSKISGVEVQDKTIKEKIYKEYLRAYKKGVFNYIKEDAQNGQNMPRKYYSGGEVGVRGKNIQEVGLNDPDAAMFNRRPVHGALYSVNAAMAQVQNNGPDAAMRVGPQQYSDIRIRLNRLLNGSSEMVDQDINYLFNQFKRKYLPNKQLAALQALTELAATHGQASKSLFENLQIIHSGEFNEKEKYFHRSYALLLEALANNTSFDKEDTQKIVYLIIQLVKIAPEKWLKSTDFQFPAVEVLNRIAIDDRYDVADRVREALDEIIRNDKEKDHVRAAMIEIMGYVLINPNIRLEDKEKEVDLLLLKAADLKIENSGEISVRADDILELSAIRSIDVVRILSRLYETGKPDVKSKIREVFRWALKDPRITEDCLRTIVLFLKERVLTTLRGDRFCRFINEPRTVAEGIHALFGISTALAGEWVDDIQLKVVDDMKAMTIKSRDLLILQLAQKFGKWEDRRYNVLEDLFLYDGKPLKIVETLKRYSPDAAMTGKAKDSDINMDRVIRGGIDLTARQMQMDVGGENIDIHFDAAMIEGFKRGDFSGVRPVIMKITPFIFEA